MAVVRWARGRGSAAAVARWQQLNPASRRALAMVWTGEPVLEVSRKSRMRLTLSRKAVIYDASGLRNT